MSRRVLVAGCGYVGCRLAELLVEAGDEVWGMRRDPTGLPSGVRPVASDVNDPSSLEDLPADLDAVVYAVSPRGRSDEAYRAAYVEGLSHVIRAAGAAGSVDAAGSAGSFRGRVVLVGSTGVYGHTDGRRVDESTDPEPADATGRRLLEAEDVARSLGAPGIVLRLGGIYGPGRIRTIRRVVEGVADCPPPGTFGNRIHRDDAADALAHILDLGDPAAVYLGVDRDPAPLREVYRWIAHRAGVADPCPSGSEGTEHDAGEAEGRRGTSKRCSSDRLVASGFRFRYPTFREGYGALMETM